MDVRFWEIPTQEEIRGSFTATYNHYRQSFSWYCETVQTQQDASLQTRVVPERDNNANPCSITSCPGPASPAIRSSKVDEQDEQILLSHHFGNKLPKLARSLESTDFSNPDPKTLSTFAACRLTAHTTERKAFFQLQNSQRAHIGLATVLVD